MYFIQLSTKDNGLPLIWMRFSTLVFLFCTARQQTFQNKTGLSIPVNLTHPKEKTGAAIVYK